VIARYGVTLQWVLQHQQATLMVAGLTLAATILLYVVAPKGFFPVQDTGVIIGISEAPQSVSFQGLSDRQQRIAKVILQDPGVQSLSSFIGVDGTNATVNGGRIQINLKPLSERKLSASDVIRRLQPELEKVEGITLFMQPVQDLTVEDRVSRTQYQYSLEGPSADELNKWAPQLVEKLQTLSQLRDVASDQQDRGLRASLVIDRNTAGRLGITPQMIDDTLYDAFGQRQVSTIFTQLNQYHVVMEVTPSLQLDPGSLSDVYVKSPNALQASANAGQPGSTSSQPPPSSSQGPANAGPTSSAAQSTANARPSSSAAIPLSAFTHFEQGVTALAINHQGQFPAVTVSFNLAPGVALGDAVKAIELAKAEIGMPTSIQAGFEGTAQAFQSSLTNEPLLILAALVTVYIVLGVLYESYIHPVTILSTLPSAGVGAILALLLCGTELDVIALIGIVLLIGIVKKNAIMMIDFALEAEREGGKSPREAIYEACLLRFRPIMMTTMAALLAGLPLALGSGVGAELRRPLGITIVGGLMLSQLLTLYTTPVIYLAFDRLARRTAQSKARRGAKDQEKMIPAEQQ
jgi:multidrug efflux pump